MSMENQMEDQIATMMITYDTTNFGRDNSDFYDMRSALRDTVERLIPQISKKKICLRDWPRINGDPSTAPISESCDVCLFFYDGGDSRKENSMQQKGNHYVFYLKDGFLRNDMFMLMVHVFKKGSCYDYFGKVQECGDLIAQWEVLNRDLVLLLSKNKFILDESEKSNPLWEEMFESRVNRTHNVRRDVSYYRKPLYIDEYKEFRDFYNGEDIIEKASFDVKRFDKIAKHYQPKATNTKGKATTNTKATNTKGKATTNTKATNTKGKVPKEKRAPTHKKAGVEFKIPKRALSSQGFADMQELVKHAKALHRGIVYEKKELPPVNLMWFYDKTNLDIRHIEWNDLDLVRQEFYNKKHAFRSLFKQRNVATILEDGFSLSHIILVDWFNSFDEICRELKFFLPRLGPHVYVKQGRQLIEAEVQPETYKTYKKGTFRYVDLIVRINDTEEVDMYPEEELQNVENDKLHWETTDLFDLYTYKEKISILKSKIYLRNIANFVCKDVELSRRKVCILFSQSDVLELEIYHVDNFVIIVFFVDCKIKGVPCINKENNNFKNEMDDYMFEFIYETLESYKILNNSSCRITRKTNDRFTWKDEKDSLSYLRRW